MIRLILVAAGGAVGSVVRYLLSVYVTRIYPSAFPFGTFAVNILGCLLIGIIYGFTERMQVSAHWRFLLATGFCGGFTTFSTFAYENMQLLETQNYATFALNTIGSCVFGFVAVFAGVMLTKLV